MAHGNAYTSVFEDASAVNQQFKLFWMLVGKDDTLVGGGDKAFEEALTKESIKHMFHFVEGLHEWTVWRNHSTNSRRCCSSRPRGSKARSKYVRSGPF